MIDQEHWRRLRHWPHEVSSHGRVRGPQGHIAPQDCGDGYTKVKLRDRGRVRQVKVHVLVAEAFLGIWLPKAEWFAEQRPVVCHRNGRRSDNRLSNLMVCTYSANALHAIAHGTSHSCPAISALRAAPKPRPARSRQVGAGERNPAGSRITLAMARRAKYGSEPASLLARAFGVSRNLIYRIRKGEKWAHA